MGPLKPLKPKYTYKKGRGQLTPKVPLDVFNEEVLGRREVPEQATSFSGRGSIFFSWESGQSFKDARPFPEVSAVFAS